MEFFEALRQSFMDPMNFWAKFTSFLPNLFAAILLLIVGHLLGKFLAMIVTRLLQKLKLDSMSSSGSLGEAAAKSGFTATPSVILGKICYWLIFLTFIISAADTLGLDRVSETIDDFVLYLPKVIGAVLVLVVGMFAAGLVRAGVEAALASIDLGYEKAIGGVLHGVIAIIVISLAIGQLDIKTDLLNQVVVIFLFAGAAAVALALGLGTRDVAGNIVAGVYARDLYVPGNQIKVGDIVGTVVEVNATSLLLDLPDGSRLTIPNSRLLDEQVEIRS